MSEAAYYAAHRAQYGCFPDEDQPDCFRDEIFCEECPKCEHAMNPDEKGSDGLCVNCTVDNVGYRLISEFERLAQRQLMPA